MGIVFGLLPFDEFASLTKISILLIFSNHVFSLYHQFPKDFWYKKKAALRQLVFIPKNLGGAEVSTEEPFYQHDFIELSPRTPSRIYEKCAPLYESGLSIRDIEGRTGIPKTTVREALKKNGMSLRNPLNGNASRIDRTKNKRGGHTPYGYDYLDGKLLIDPKEQIIIRKILKLHQSGLSGNAIARELNNQKIPSRNGKSWCPSVVREIIKRNKSKQTKSGGSNE